MIQTGYFQDYFEEENENNCVALEPLGLFGIPDVLVLNIKNDNGEEYTETIAFELKLRKWKRALVQAFKYRAFAEKSYVVIDEGNVGPAIKSIEMFQKSNIGLLSIDEGGTVKSYFEPNSEDPYSEYYHNLVCEKVENNSTIL